LVALEEVPIQKSAKPKPGDPEFNESDFNPEIFYVDIENTQGISRNMQIVVVKIAEVSNKDTITDHIKNERIDNTQAVSHTPSALKKMLLKQSIFTQLDIYLEDESGNRITEYAGVYTVRLLLPEEFWDRTNIRVVYNREDMIEVFDTERNGNWITFETTHFSDFYLIGDAKPSDPEYKAINLWWVIIIEIVLIVGLVACILWKLNDNHKKAQANSFFVPLLLAVIIPKNAYIIIGVLAAVIVGLALFLTYLFIKLKIKSDKVNLSSKDVTAVPETPEPQEKVQTQEEETTAPETEEKTTQPEK
ncbi:MAG: hypothetical protein WC292_06690, partial [Clostridia bacterium]